MQGHVGNDKEAKGNDEYTNDTNEEQGTTGQATGKALEPVPNGKDTEMTDAISEVNLTECLSQLSVQHVFVQADFGRSQECRCIASDKAVC